MALLDISTIDRELDLAHQDTVKSDVVHETYQIFNSSGHRWYFAKDQMPDEAWLFIQATSGENPPPGKWNATTYKLQLILSLITTGVPHTAFNYPAKSETDHLRESIECRGFAFYD